MARNCTYFRDYVKDKQINKYTVVLLVFAECSIVTGHSQHYVLFAVTIVEYVAPFLLTSVLKPILRPASKAGSAIQVEWMKETRHGELETCQLQTARK